MVCSKCQVQHKAYYIVSHKQWQCKHCKYRFSVTSNTIFAHHKLLLWAILFACAIYVNAVKVYDKKYLLNVKMIIGGGIK
ncbi:hypothetical protein [Bartonella jaculi]|uniref:hypothetical protein n=1 Tax=Bartonella jaculi TaxID=686226 RepID=UPI003CD0989B